MKRNICLIAIFLAMFSSFNLFAQSQGESLFKENKPKDAAKVLENEILNGIVSSNTYNFLGLAYYQTGDYSKSIDAFNRGIKEQPGIAKLLTYNQGNTYYAMKDYTSAISCYTQVINEDAEFYDAYLNRANALLMANQLKVAKNEYVDYLVKCPEDKQRPEIERLIKALEEEILRREEEERLLAELDKAKWEEYDASFEESENDEDSIAWESVDAGIAEEKKPEEKKPEENTEWESVEAKIPENKKDPEVNPDWEKVDAPIAEEKKEEPGVDWEKVLFEKELAKNQFDKKDYEPIYENDEFNEWQTLSLEDEDELKQLEKSSKEEHDKWVAEQERIIRNKEKEQKRMEADEKLRLQVQKEKEEQEFREKVMNEMMRAENERKQKLLDDLANSLMNSESTNMSSGADDIMEYDLEGELD